jgi:crotonobetainyl-CoA:carnitine CoA-transferase CaiB-like acyl-CoA transferase
MSAAQEQASPLALEGVRVIDIGSLFAGPLVATLMGDFGADVIKVEHPQGDNLRKLAWQRDGQSLWWAVAARNKRSVTLKLSDPRGGEALKRLVENADVLVESFRTGTLERWGLGWDVLHEINPRLVMLRTTGFGQTGPYRRRPGYGTLAEAFSGYAHINGFPEGAPTLPPFALADSVAALAGAFATMSALHWRDRSGVGQMIDVSLYEPLFWILGPQATVYDQLDEVQERTGNRAPFTSPRNAYESRDGVWLAMSASSQSVAERVAALVGRPDFVEEPWFSDHTGRLAHQDELDEVIAAWIGARDAGEVIEAFEAAEAAIAPILSIADAFEDEQYAARETITTVEHPLLGPLKMQNVIARLTETPGRIERCGPVTAGEHNDEVLRGELGYSPETLDQLVADGVVGDWPRREAGYAASATGDTAEGASPRRQDGAM